MDLSLDPATAALDGTTVGSLADSYTRNGFGEVDGYSASHNSSVFYDYALERDRLGRIVRRSETVDGDSFSYAYTYDAAGRLHQVYSGELPCVPLTVCTLSDTFTYDANGNRLSHASGASTATGTYDLQDRLLSYGPSGASASYSYANWGALKTKTLGSAITNYTYDAFGNLLQVDLPGGLSIAYVVDPDGRRVARQENGVFTHRWLYAGGLSPVAEVDGNGQLIRRYVYATGRNVPDYMVEGSSTYRLITDHLGSVRLVVDIADGSVVQQVDYDAWGNVVADSNPGFQPFGVAGGLYDPETGLVRFGARDYDAASGRWTSKDPIMLAGGLNVYEYAAGGPVNLLDVTGAAPMTSCSMNPTCAAIMGGGGASIITAAQRVANSPAAKRTAQAAQSCSAGASRALSSIQAALPQAARSVSIARRSLTSSDLGVRGALAQLKGTFEVTGNVARVRVDMIEGQIQNPLQIINNLSQVARDAGATTLRIEGTLANPRLLSVLKRRYGLITQGGSDLLNLPL